MTTSELLESIKRTVLENDPEQIVNVFQPLTKAQRSKLAQPMREFVRGVTEYPNSWGSQKPEQVKQEVQALGFDIDKFRNRFYDEHHPSTTAAIYATQPKSELLKEYVDSASSAEGIGNCEAWDNALLQVLLDRNLKWTDAWIAELLVLNQGESGNGIAGKMVLHAIRTGLIKQPDSDPYRVCLAEMLRDDYEPAKALAADRAELLNNDAFRNRDVYRLFMLDTDLFGSPRRKKYQTLLREAFKKKRVDRVKFLRALLQALMTDLKQNRAQALIKFYKSLTVKAGETTELSDEFLTLLGNERSFVCAFAWEKANELYDKRKIAAATILEKLPAVFQCETKGTPSKALKWTKQAVRLDDSLVPLAVDVCLSALKHPESSIQKSALDQLGDYSPRMHADHAVAIDAPLNTLAPTNRKPAGTLLQKLTGITPSASEEDLQETVAGLSVPELPNRESVSILDVNPPIERIEKHEQLIDAIANAIEGTDDAMTVERILAAISELGPVPESMQDRAGPVLQSTREIRRGSSMTSSAGSRSLVAAPDATQWVERVLCLALGMTELVLLREDYCEEDAKSFGLPWPPRPEPMQLPRYMTHEDYDAESQGYAYRALNYAWHSRLWWHRLQAIEERLREFISLPLLATPTHGGGWIEPAVLIDRIQRWQAANRPLDEADLVLALLRLAPERRGAARKKLSQLNATSKLHQLRLRPVDETKKKKRQAYRDAFTEQSDLAPELVDCEIVDILRIALDEPDLSKVKSTSPDLAYRRIASHVRSATLEPEQIQRLELDPAFIQHKLPIEFDWRANVDCTNPKDRVIPTMLVQRTGAGWIDEHFLLAEVYRTLHAELHPTSAWKLKLDAWNDQYNRDCHWINAIVRMASRTENGPANHTPYAAYLEALFDPHSDWSTAACGAAVVSMIGRDTDARAVGLDACDEAIAAGRVQPDTMSAAMYRVLLAPWPRVKRMAEVCQQLSDIAAVHQRFLAECFGELIRRWCEDSADPDVSYDRLAKPADCAPVLELYLQLLVGLNLSPNQNQRLAFASPAAKGKVAKLLKQLAAL